jgi:hypothetical protein
VIIRQLSRIAAFFGGSTEAATAYAMSLCESPEVYDETGLPTAPQEPAPASLGVDLSVWDAQVRLTSEAEKSRRSTPAFPASEHEILDLLATLTDRRSDNGPWHAALALFSPPAGTGAS